MDSFLRITSKNPKVKFLPAYGCSAHIVKEKRLPSFTDLDKMVDIPLLIVKYDGHAAGANLGVDPGVFGGSGVRPRI